MNYYMAFGGTSFGRHVGGPDIITSYDYDVAINEYGYRSEPKFSLLSMLHEAIFKVQGSMFDSNPVFSSITGVGPKHCESHTYFDGKSDKCAVFFSNVGYLRGCSFGTILVPPWSVTIAEGRKDGSDEGSGCGSLVSLHNTKASLSLAPRPNQLSASIAEDITVFNAGVKSVVEVPKFSMPPDEAVTSESPLEQLSLTKDETDYLWYSFNYKSQANLTAATLEFEYAIAGGIGLMVFVNGDLKRIRRTVSREIWPEATSFSTHIEFFLPLVEGDNDISILSAARGLRNYGPYLERNRVGIVSDIIVEGKVCHNVVHTIGMDGEKSNGEGKLRGGQGALTWYSLEFKTPSDLLSRVLAIDLSSMGKGAAYLNGNHIGRFWDSKLIRNETKSDEIVCIPCIESDYVGMYEPTRCRTGCKDPTQAFYKLPLSWFREAGEVNEVLLFSETGGDADSVSIVNMGMTERAYVASS